MKHNKGIAADCKVHKSDQSPDQKKECRKHRQPNTHMFPRPGDSNTPLGSAELLRNYSRKCVLTWSCRHLTWIYHLTWSCDLTWICHLNWSRHLTWYCHLTWSCRHTALVDRSNGCLIVTAFPILGQNL